MHSLMHIYLTVAVHLVCACDEIPVSEPAITRMSGENAFIDGYPYGFTDYVHCMAQCLAAATASSLMEQLQCLCNF